MPDMAHHSAAFSTARRNVRMEGREWKKRERSAKDIRACKQVKPAALPR
jgi:hypothetical protein